MTQPTGRNSSGIPLRLPLIGRDAEIAALDEQLALARIGAFRVALVTGEPGIGKSRLVNELAERHRDAAVIVGARAFELGMTYSLALWIEAFERLLGPASTAEVRRLCGSSARDLALVLRSAPVAAVTAFTAAGLAARLGCACHEQKESASGTGTAAAVAVHRFLEGSAIALAGSAAVAVALAMHAFGEGLAAGALLGTRPRRHVACWLAAMSISPVLGAAASGVLAVPAAAEPVLVALAAGILAQAARISLRAAFHGLRPSSFLLSRATAATTAAILTTVAVHAVG